MNIPSFSIKNYQFTLMLFLVLFLAGLASFSTMPRSEDPALDIPVVVVIAIYPGANPTDIESQVVDPFEEVINELDDLKELETKINDGVAVFSVEFNYGVDVDDKEEEVQRRINSVMDQVPELFALDVFKVTTENVKIFQMALVSNTVPYFEMKEEAERIKKKLEKGNGVRKVEVEGYPEREVRIALNPVKMTEMNISLDNVERAIKSSNANIPGGALKISNKLFNIKTSGMYDDLSQIENTVVGSFQGKIIYLKNIAAVYFDYEDDRWLARFNKDRCIFLNVEMKHGNNIFNVADPLRQEILATKTNKDIDIEFVVDQGLRVEKRINSFLGNLLQGILLVGIIIFLVLGYRSATLVMLAIPFSILIGLLVVNTLGIGLQQISIAGLVVALGLLVDNSIAIIENIERFLKQGLSRDEAAIKGTQQLIAPMASATLTTVLAFVPMLMMPDTTGAFIQGIPVTVVCTLIASFLVAVTLTPFLASRILKTQVSSSVNQQQVAEKTDKEHQTKTFRLLKQFVEEPYRRAINWGFKHKLFMGMIALLTLVLSGVLFPLVGVSFFPKAEVPQFRVTVDLPNGSNIDATNEAMIFVENTLEAISGIKNYTSNVGHGNPQIYYNVNEVSYRNNYGEVIVNLDRLDLEQFYGIIDTLRQTFNAYPAARINVIEYAQGPPIEAAVSVKIVGEELAELQKYANRIESIVQNTPGALNVSNSLGRNSTDLHFNINRDKAMILGVPIFEIDKTIRSFVNGTNIGKFRDKNAEDYDIIMRFDDKEQFEIEDFDKLSVQSLSGKFIPLKHLANIEFKEAPSQITHLDMERTATILADIDEKNYTLDDVVNVLIGEFDKIDWKEGYTYSFKGELATRNESFGGMGVASGLAVLLILGVLVIQFKSFSQPLIIFSALPLAFLGSILALLLTGWHFSFTAFVGFTSLIGIAINNSIILVDFANELRAKGVAVREAAAQSAEVRFIPILLTTLTTILGLLPLTLTGGSMWAPMGWVIIGGLMTSTFFVLLLVPILYEVFTAKN